MTFLPSFELPWSEAQEIPATPFYLYGEAELEILFESFREPLTLNAQGKMAVELHFAMKANSNPDVLNFFRKKGAGLDIVSGGELKQALELGFKGKDIVFSGVGKSRAELKEAVLQDVSLINVESRGELERLSALCLELQRKARIALRVNPDVGAETHPYIATGLEDHKFGVDFNEAWDLYRSAAQNPAFIVEGISLHIGSQILDLNPLKVALSRTLDLALRLKRDLGISLKVFDVGGGLGIPYARPSEAAPYEVYGKIIKDFFEEWQKLEGPEAKVVSECGRALVAQAGWLVSRVIGTKHSGKKDFVIVDASMTELIRPALYQAEHPITALVQGPRRSVLYDVVGPVCESSDVLGHARLLPELTEGDLVVIGATGAYGAVMASTYNARPLPEEWWKPVLGKPRPSKLLRPPEKQTT